MCYGYFLTTYFSIFQYKLPKDYIIFFLALIVSALRSVRSLVLVVLCPRLAVLVAGSYGEVSGNDGAEVSDIINSRDAMKTRSLLSDAAPSICLYEER